MTDSTPPDSTAVPDPAVVGEHTAANGQCEQADSQQQQQQQPNTESQGEGFKMDQEMKITESIEDRGRRCEICLKFTGCPVARAHSVRNATESSAIYVLATVHALHLLTLAFIQL